MTKAKKFMTIPFLAAAVVFSLILVPIMGVATQSGASVPTSLTYSSSGLTYSISLSDSVLPADGTSISTLTITVTDASTNAPVPGQNIGADCIFNGNQVCPTFNGWRNVITDAAGVSSFAVLAPPTSGCTSNGYSPYNCKYFLFIDNYTSSPSDYISVAQGGPIPEISFNDVSCTSGNYFSSGTCVAATPGHYATGGATTSQIACQVGHYQPNSGQSTCLTADVGYYVAFTGAASEVAAPIGSYVSVTGSSAPTPCPSGSTTSSTGQSACVIVVPPIVYSKPTSPSNVTASMSNGTATVSFSPGSSGNLPTYNQIDMYINGVLAGNVCNVSGASSCPISNLGPDVSFTFTVTAINSKGSAASALSNSVSYASPSFAMPTTTTTTTVPPVMKTITCVKGASSKKVTALNPVCPAGYKKK